MSKASKLARAQKNVPAVSQKILAKANRWYNNSTTTTNTSTPVEGSAGSDDAFWLLEEATDSPSSGAPGTGTKMLIDDLSLSYLTSHVKLSVNANMDTTNANVNSILKLQRSSDNGNTWLDIGVADAVSGKSRIRATSQIEHGGGDRNMGSGGFCFTDTSPGSLTPQYRVLVSIYVNLYSYLNRDSALDASGSGIGNNASNTTLARTISTFTAEEIINY